MKYDLIREVNYFGRIVDQTRHYFRVNTMTYSKW